LVFIIIALFTFLLFVKRIKGVYTLMGPELDEHGWVKNPIKCDWKTGAVFSTPPGWW
jgi:hypothetical protein